MQPAYTYDPATPLGQVRLLLGDTNVTPDATGNQPAIFSDAELMALLTYLSGGSVHIAASLALEALAADAARLVLRIKTQNSDTDATSYAGQLRSQAQELRKIATSPILVKSPDQVFIPDYGNGKIPGNMDIW